MLFAYESASCTVTDWKDGTATVSEVVTRDRRKGHATGLMKRVVEWADRYHVVLKLAAESYGEDVKSLQLADFYSRFGFVRTEYEETDYIYMERPQ